MRTGVCVCVCVIYLTHTEVHPFIQGSLCHPILDGIIIWLQNVFIHSYIFIHFSSSRRMSHHSQAATVMESPILLSFLHLVMYSGNIAVEFCWSLVKSSKCKKILVCGCVRLKYVTGLFWVCKSFVLIKGMLNLNRTSNICFYIHFVQTISLSLIHFINKYYVLQQCCFL